MSDIKLLFAVFWGNNRLLELQFSAPPPSAGFLHLHLSSFIVLRWPEGCFLEQNKPPCCRCASSELHFEFFPVQSVEEHGLVQTSLTASQ